MIRYPKILLFWLMFFLFWDFGCRRAPANPTLLYESEKARIEEAKKEPEAFLPDRYPWESRTAGIRELPQRLESYDSQLTREMNVVDRAVYGSPKNPLYRHVYCCPGEHEYGWRLP